MAILGTAVRRRALRLAMLAAVSALIGCFVFELLRARLIHPGCIDDKISLSWSTAATNEYERRFGTVGSDAVGRWTWEHEPAGRHLWLEPDGSFVLAVGTRVVRGTWRAPEDGALLLATVDGRPKVALRTAWLSCPLKGDPLESSLDELLSD